MNRVVDLNVNELGNLVISVLDWQEVSDMDTLDTYGEMKLYEALEYQLCNSDMAYTCDISDWGHLSEAPGILTNIVYDEDGVPTDYTEMYWYPNYMVSDCWKVLLETGSVTFIRA